MELVSKLENPIRIKVTGKCNRKCFFCHQEGGMNIDSITFSDKMKEMIETLSTELEMHSVALTGGEPLLHKDLAILSSQLMKCKGIEKISLTTNGTIAKGKEFWNELKNNGLYKVNISMPDILAGNAVHFEPLLCDISSDSIFQNQRRIIRTLNLLGIEVKINIAVINDELYTLSVLNQLLSMKDLNFEIVLLPNITNEKTFSYSKTVIDNIISMMKLELVATRTREYTSNSIFFYENEDGKKINVKTTKLNNTPKWLTSMCKNCMLRNKCQEGFYGLRIEQVEGILYVRLCIHKSSKETLMTFDEFIESAPFYELKEHWGR